MSDEGAPDAPDSLLDFFFRLFARFVFLSSRASKITESESSGELESSDVETSELESLCCCEADAAMESPDI